MDCVKDNLAFMYVHKDNGEIVFTSRTAPLFCHIPNGDFQFADLVADKLKEVSGSKLQTRSQAPEMNKYSLPLINRCQSGSWEGIICEKFIDGGYHGVVFTSSAPGMDYIAKILLEKGATARSSLLLPTSLDEEEANDISADLVEVFEKNLIHFPAHDEWFTSGGKEKFTEQVKYHVVRNIPLQLVLPAFPAKSCNTSKTISQTPDKGEELAIRSMKIVADKVEAVYPPGLHFNVVSDGHVFSDLVGVDDACVDDYGSIFRKMANDLYPGLVTFYGLDDFLVLQDNSVQETLKMIFGTHLEHPIETELTSRAEMARRIMVFLFGSNDAWLKHAIEVEKDPETLALYSGFKRFMIEDLAQHRTCKALPSKASGKKLCSKVAFLMIKRNKAYSTLVEWLFPLQTSHLHSPTSEQRTQVWYQRRTPLPGGNPAGFQREAIPYPNTLA